MTRASGAILTTTKIQIAAASAPGLVPAGSARRGCCAARARRSSPSSRRRSARARRLCSTEWHAAPRRARPFAWLSLDRGDNDPVRFLEGAIAALRTVARAPASRRSRISAARRASTDVVLPSLVNDLARAAAAPGPRPRRLPRDRRPAGARGGRLPPRPPAGDAAARDRHAGRAAAAARAPARRAASSSRSAPPTCASPTPRPRAAQRRARASSSTPRDVARLQRAHRGLGRRAPARGAVAARAATTPRAFISVVRRRRPADRRLPRLRGARRPAARGARLPARRPRSSTACAARCATTSPGGEGVRRDARRARARRAAPAPARHQARVVPLPPPLRRAPAPRARAHPARGRRRRCTGARRRGTETPAGRRGHPARDRRAATSPSRAS